MKFRVVLVRQIPIGRSPHGERGLKSHCCTWSGCHRPSLPSRGAWIEIGSRRASGPPPGRRSPHGERGLKSADPTLSGPRSRRSPHGERGLKSLALQRAQDHRRSLPSRGAWIEIFLPHGDLDLVIGRSPHGERGLKFRHGAQLGDDVPSLPSRGAWIEITAPGPCG